MSGALWARESGVFWWGWIPSWKTTIHDCPHFFAHMFAFRWQICNAFFQIQINYARLFTTYVSKCWVFLVFHLGCVFFPACDTAALRQKKYNPFEQILLRTSIWEFNHFFLRSKTFTLCNDTHTQSVSNQCYAAHWIAYQMAVHKSVPCTTLRRNLKSIYMRIWNAFGNPMIFFSSIPFRQRVRKVVN